MNVVFFKSDNKKTISLSGWAFALTLAVSTHHSPDIIHLGHFVYAFYA